MTEFLNPLNWFRWLGQLIGGWFVSLPLRELPKAILAVAFLALMVICTFAAQSETSDWRGRLLDRQLRSSVDRDDFDTAELILNRKLAMSPDDSQLLFQLGMTKDSLDDREGATKLMRGLVTVKRHEPAARWLLQNSYLGKDWNQLSQADKDEFGDLLRLIYTEAPNDIAIKNLYADFLIADQNFVKAIPLLDDLARAQPMRGLQAAALSRRLGNTATADRLARRTLVDVEKLFAEDPSNSILALAVAQNQLFLKRYSEAVRTLEQGISRAKTDPEKRQLMQAMGDGIVVWVQSVQASEAKDTESERLRVLKMLQVALRYAPNNPRVLTLVADQVLATMDDKDAQVATIRKALVAGTSPGIAHFIRGTAYLMNDDLERAAQSLELAANELPQSGAILNNLAVALSMRQDADYERALKISEQAIKQTPDASPHFFETRGQILERLGRYKEAIPDLERALSVPSLKKNAHLSLAKCYENLGDPDVAGMHLEAAAEEQEKQTTSSVTASDVNAREAENVLDAPEDSKTDFGTDSIFDAGIKASTTMNDPVETGEKAEAGEVVEEAAREAEAAVTQELAE